MTIDDVKKGEVFAIEGTTSYPKLKLENGYIDMRDEIVNETGDTVKGKGVQLMTVEEVSKKCGLRDIETEDWISQLKSEHIKD